MIPIREACTCAFAVLATIASAQDAPGRIYQSSGFELAFMYPQLDYKGTDAGGVVRFAPVVQAQHALNIDLGSYVGLFVGASVNNVGFIYDDPDGVTRYKFRTYNLGIPVGIKLGRMNGALLFAGGSIEWPISYRQKRFQYGTKVDRFTSWFSERVENPQLAVMLGAQIRQGPCIKVKYYVTNFHDQDFTETEQGMPDTPYAGFNAHILCVSLGFALFQDHHTAYGI